MIPDWPALIAGASSTSSRRRRAYVAGPYRSDTENGVLHNILARRSDAERLWARGYAALCPHMNTAFMGGLIKQEAFIEGDLAWLECADVLTVPDGWRESIGTCKEHGLAVVLGLEIVNAKDIELIPFMLQPEYRPWHIARDTHWRAQPADLIVIHHEGASDDAETPAAAINRYHAESNGWGGIGYHFWIRRSGLIEVGRPLWAVGAHAKNHNSHSWGVCLDGNFNVRPPTDIQLQSLRTLLRYLNYLSPGAVLKGHRELEGMLTDCPGKLFPIDWLRSRLGKEV
jgi:hypothetical protein